MNPMSGGLDTLEAACPRLFPKGKLYSSRRAVLCDVRDWVASWGFTVERKEVNTEFIICCTKQSPKEECTLQITLEEEEDNLLSISDRSFHRSSIECESTNLGRAYAKPRWIELNDRKEFSRLLYTNPVCFLGTQSAPGSRRDLNDTNVMVLSWLTATNNEGNFMFSLNKNRHTASMLRDEFTLSVPVQGMEDIVLAVGGVSKRWGVSKFPRDHLSSERPATEPDPTSQNKKRKGPRFPLGIPSLECVPIGNFERDEEEKSKSDNKSFPFAIKGTVAHLLCRVIHKVAQDDWVDMSHLVVFARVTKAHVLSSYWDVSKKLFRPDSQSLPYLTFFGSQTFGYVSPEPL